MSINAITAAFRLDLPSHLKWLAVCLADHADPHGGSCYPSIATLAQKTGMTERSVQRNLAELRDRGLIRRDAPPPTLLRRPGSAPNAWRLVFVTAPLVGEAPRPNTKSCPPDLRIEVIEAFDHTCAYCGRRGQDATPGGDLDPDGEAWTIDRIVPGSRGGSYSPENVTLACRRCNVQKGAKMAPSSVATLADRGATDVVYRRHRRRRGGATDVARGVPLMASEPGTEPGTEPSMNLSRAERAPAIEIPTRLPTKAQIAREQHRFGKEAERVWLETTARVGSPYTDRGALRIVHEHAIAATRWATEPQILAAIRRRMDAKSTPRRIPEWARLEVGEAEERDHRTREMAERAATDARLREEPVDPAVLEQLKDAARAMRMSGVPS